ncbi:molecular chaperone DnaJ [Altererythrobacter confluentis]|uniref:Molecular chaperone DnaJ n=2 Tax=Allopontixanthobacter confluentis TaxID=1849021 RepID=A0A6L7GHS8_9SPHN|nr:molecular chaperone DnaJ [Allopontixanthobacter confluentis]
MLRYILIAGLACLCCKMFFGRWPWEFASAQPARRQALSRARSLLGVSATASRSEVIEAHKRRVAMVHPDRGGTNDQVHEANAARDLLIGDLPDLN